MMYYNVLVEILLIELEKNAISLLVNIIDNLYML